MMDGPTKYGFRWGPAEVVRASTHKGDVVLFVQGARQAVSIRVTPTGLVKVGPVQKPIPTSSDEGGQP